jgi:hypothetical protein
MKIQEYLTSAIQNIQTLIRYGSNPKKAMAARMVAAKTAIIKAITPAVAMATNDVLWHRNSGFVQFFKEHESEKCAYPL